MRPSAVGRWLCKGADNSLQQDFGRTKVAKITVSVPRERLLEAKRAVAEGRAASVSAYVSEAMGWMEQAESLERLVIDLEERFGSPDAQDEAWAEAVIAAAQLPADDEEPSAGSDLPSASRADAR